MTHMSSIHYTLPAVTTPSHACAEEECAICLEVISEGTAVIMPGCAHKFHGQCLVQNMLVSRRCPLCRNDPSRQDGRDDDTEEYNDEEGGPPALRRHMRGRSPEEQHEIDIFHYYAARDRAISLALDTADPETMRQAHVINKHSIEFHKLDKESASLEHKVQKYHAECRKEMVQCRTRSQEQYKTDHCELLARKDKAEKSYRYTTVQTHDACKRITQSGGYGYTLGVLDYATSLKLAKLMPRGNAQTKMIATWKERHKQSYKELRIVRSEDSKVRKQINRTVTQELKVIGDRFKHLEDVKSLSERIIAIRKKQCIIRRKMYAARDSIAMRHGWVQQPDIVVDHLLRWRRRDAELVRTRFFVSHYPPLLKLTNLREYRPLRRMRSARRVGF